MDLVKHRIGAPDMQGIGREPEHYRGVERYVGLLCDLARRRPGRGTRDEVVTERSEHPGKAHRRGDPREDGGQQVQAAFLAWPDR